MGFAENTFYLTKIIGLSGHSCQISGSSKFLHLSIFFHKLKTHVNRLLKTNRKFRFVGIHAIRFNTNKYEENISVHFNARHSEQMSKQIIVSFMSPELEIIWKKSENRFVSLLSWWVLSNQIRCFSSLGMNDVHTETISRTNIHGRCIIH